MLSHSALCLLSYSIAVHIINKFPKDFFLNFLLIVLPIFAAKRLRSQLMSNILKQYISFNTASGIVDHIKSFSPCRQF